jgi:hypothetical protein
MDTMTTRVRTMMLAAALAVACTIPVVAHHSFAMYDMNQTKTFTGRLARYIPGANHAQLIFDLLDDSGKPILKEGKPEQWGVETGSAAALARQGVTVDSFPVGTIITVDLHPLRNGRNFGALAGVLIKCGTAMPSGGCTKATGQLFLTGSAQ